MPVLFPGAKLIGAALALLSAAPVAAQPVVSIPGWCAQFYPDANCQNYGLGNPTRATVGRATTVGRVDRTCIMAIITSPAVDIGR